MIVVKHPVEGKILDFSIKETFEVAIKMPVVHAGIDLILAIFKIKPT